MNKNSPLRPSERHASSSSGRRLMNQGILGALATLMLRPGLALAEDQLDRVLSRKRLRVAVPKEFPPFGFMKGSYPDGFDISVARLLGLELGITVELVPVQSADRIPYLLEDKVDLIIASLGKNPEREKQVDFSKVYAPLYLGVFGRQTGSAPLDFKGRAIGVSKGSVEESEAARQLPGARLVGLENSRAILEAYAKGEVDYIAAGNMVVESIPDVGLRDQTRRLFVLKDSPCYIGVRKGEPRLLARINKFIDEAGPRALTVNAMIWFKSTFPADFYKQANGKAP